MDSNLMLIRQNVMRAEMNARSLRKQAWGEMCDKDLLPGQQRRGLGSLCRHDLLNTLLL